MAAWERLIGWRLIEGLATGESPCTWEYIVWMFGLKFVYLRGYILETIALNFTMFTENNTMIIFSHVLQTLGVYRVSKKNAMEIQQAVVHHKFN